MVNATHCATKCESLIACVEEKMANQGSQEEALAFFRSHAKEWSSKAGDQSANNVNIVKQRNDYVLHIIRQRQSTGIVLDVGSGTGDLVLDLARQGIRGTGVDFAAEMIQISNDKASKENLGLAQFYCTSIFDFDLGQQTYDCISANGFIEYISCNQLLQFIGKAYRALKKHGSLVMGSRNRLFNLFSLNDFTQQEIEASTSDMLLMESIAIAKNTSLGELLSLESPPLPSERLTQVKTGIDVSLRLQYTPLQLIKLLVGAGFEVVDIYPIHIHAVVPQFKDRRPQVHVEISNQLQAHALQHRELIPHASSFMMHAKKVA